MVSFPFLRHRASEGTVLGQNPNQNGSPLHHETAISAHLGATHIRKHHTPSYFTKLIAMGATSVVRHLHFTIFFSSATATKHHHKNVPEQTPDR